MTDQTRYFELGHVFNSLVTDALEPQRVGAIGAYHAGLWECSLADNSLIWSGGVYDLFGLERGVPITRQDALAHYTEDSRVKLERLRAYAIRHELGFTIDVDIHAGAVGQRRCIRVIAAPDYDGGVPVCLRGFKLIV